MTEDRLGKVGTGVDTPIMPDLSSQVYFDPASGGFGILDYSETAPPVACWQVVLGLEVGHFDICFRLDRRTPHHRHCQNLTVGVSPTLVSDYLGLELQAVHIVLEAHARTVVDRSRGKTSSRLHELAHSSQQMCVDPSLCMGLRLRI